MGADFKTFQEWNSMKEKMAHKLIGEICKLTSFVPGDVQYCAIATPQDLYQRTLNYKGAAYGWELTPSQLIRTDLVKMSNINNLFLTGHWSTLGHGLSGAIYSGYNCSQLVFKKIKNF